VFTQSLKNSDNMGWIELAEAQFHWWSLLFCQRNLGLWYKL